MRRALAFVGVFLLGVLVAGPIAVVAGVNDHSGDLDRQQAMALSASVSTSSRGWNDIPGLSGMLICAINEVSVTTSLAFNGAPVSVRVQMDDGPTLQPIVARFDPSSGTTSFSFTFVGNAGTFEANDNHVFDVQWRSPTGGPVTLNRGNMNVLFEEGPGPGNTCPS